LVPEDVQSAADGVNQAQIRYAEAADASFVQDPNSPKTIAEIAMTDFMYQLSPAISGDYNAVKALQ